MPHNINKLVDFIEEISNNPRQIVNDPAAAQPNMDFMQGYRELSRRILSRPNGQRVGKALIDLIGAENELLNPVFGNRRNSMNNLEIIKHTDFYGVDCDFYKTDTDDIVMTAEQLGRCLGYAEARKAVGKIVERNAYMKEAEFSAVVKMTTAQGTAQNTRIFSEDGIYEITMLSKTEKAREFRAFVRKTLKAIRKGEVKVLPTDKYKQALAEAKLLNARTRVSNQWLKIAEQVTTAEMKQVCASYAGNTLAGCEVIPLPVSEQRHYSATEIGEMFGLSAKMVGSIANKNGLKTEEFGKWFHDKASRSTKQVETFRYNDRGVQKFREILGVDQQTA